MAYPNFEEFSLFQIFLGVFVMSFFLTLYIFAVKLSFRMLRKSMRLMNEFLDERVGP